ncbi:DNA polymerase I B, mitochondrial [Vitis vinifera]|uniref:DNA polymerase I B, mitochondrial n=1 Tax=Vitis vinifera TaxID=29760 RepID=A0A438E5F5_VITVI|nr:DNA polymerase I B, mitochondrial [Vitis vinifera]
MRGAALAGSCRRCCNISMGEVHPLRCANGTLPGVIVFNNTLQPSAWPSRARGRFYSSSWAVGFGATSGKGNLRSSVGQGCIDHGQLKAQTHGPLYNSSVQGQIFAGDIGCETMTNDCASNVLAYPEKIQAGNKHISRNNVNSTAPHHSRKVVQSNGSLSMKPLEDREEANFIFSRDRAADAIENDESNERSIIPATGTHAFSQLEARRKLSKIYEKVLIVDDIYVAKKIVRKLTTQYKHLIHAFTLIICFLIISQVANIDVKRETPVDHGEIICFSIYSGPEADFGNGKSCIWVDVLDGGGRDLLVEFAPFFEDPSIQKVWHNYSFDNHVIENYDLKVSGFHADTMHMARLWDSSRRAVGGYSLEALTRDSKVMSGAHMSNGEELIGKVSMKTIFGKKKLKKDGTEGKIITIAPVEVLQREDRKPWISYSALDSMSTLKLYESMKNKLLDKEWLLDGARKGCMFDFYQKYWRPFGELLVQMETEGMLVDRAYLSKVEKVAKAEEQVAANRFRNWASKHCPDAKYMNVGSDTQLRQLLFGGVANR